MPRYFFMYFAFALSTSLTQCSKPAVVTPTDQNSLPAATQSGANTFGCLVNGKPFIAKSPDRFAQYSTHWYYDDNSYGGEFSFIGFGTMLTDKPNGEGMGFTLDSLNYRRILTTDFDGNEFMFAYSDQYAKDRKCASFGTEIVFIDTSKTFYRSGRCTISRFDKNAHIISGTFNCTILKPGCDTFKITDGRFDISF